MAVTKTWKVYGADGHRQRMSFGESVRDDFTGSNEWIKGIRIFEAINADKTGTNDYTIIKITRETAKECDEELEGQISDGYSRDHECVIIFHKWQQDNENRIEAEYIAFNPVF